MCFREDQLKPDWGKWSLCEVKRGDVSRLFMLDVYGYFNRERLSEDNVSMAAHTSVSGCVCQSSVRQAGVNLQCVEGAVEPFEKVSASSKDRCLASTSLTPSYSSWSKRIREIVDSWLS